MQIPLIIVKTNANNPEGLGIHTPIVLTGLSFIFEARTKDGDLLVLAPEDVAPHPGCKDPMGCYMQRFTMGRENDCSVCMNKNLDQIAVIALVFGCITALKKGLLTLLEKMTEGMFHEV